MTTVTVIGDCHTSRAYEHYYPNEAEVEFFFWGKHGERAFDISFEKLEEQDVMSSGVEMCRGIDHRPDTFKNVKDEGLVMLWIGYVDIRQNLPKHKNADLIAKSYVDRVKAYFKNAKVMFIEPLPQFTEMILKYEGISEVYTYEERQQQNKEFLAALEKYRIEAGFEESIRQTEILAALGVDELTVDMTHNDAPHPVDGLRPEYMKKIYDLFERKAKETIDRLNL